MGEYRIDLVVEGPNGNRLAIECDGDRFHGPDKWESDMRRQRILERAGWHFWRCFASTFTLHRPEMIQDLLCAIDEQGIKPLGIEHHAFSLHTESRKYTAFESKINQSELKEI